MFKIEKFVLIIIIIIGNLIGAVAVTMMDIVKFYELRHIVYDILTNSQIFTSASLLLFLDFTALKKPAHVLGRILLICSVSSILPIAYSGYLYLNAYPQFRIYDTSHFAIFVAMWNAALLYVIFKMGADTTPPDILDDDR